MDYANVCVFRKMPYIVNNSCLIAEQKFINQKRLVSPDLYKSEQCHDYEKQAAGSGDSRIILITLTSWKDVIF